MTSNRLIPPDPLAFIRQCVSVRQILWTYHVNLRLEKRFIPRDFVMESVNEYEIIESYPDDKYLPSYLVLTNGGGEQIHILFATDVENANLRVVTAYRPDPNEWSEDMKRRKENEVPPVRRDNGVSNHGSAF